MYFPYFRGKQNELILLRDNADFISQSSIIPIIEPVKKNTNPIKKCIASLIADKAQFILITNPKYGDFTEEKYILEDTLLEDDSLKNPYTILGFILDEKTQLDDLNFFLSKYTERKIALIHYGYSHGTTLANMIQGNDSIKYHIFIEDKPQKRYRRHFRNETSKRILIQDGFKKQNNKSYPKTEHFSELHITYEEEGMDGFGDFTITGDDYLESGGPAYAVAIHLTYIDENDENDMHINHYISDRNASAADPGGKFLEALSKLIKDLENNSKIFHSEATEEFKTLHNKEHFPGLGYVKKLSMQHHLELISNFLKEKG